MPLVKHKQLDRTAVREALADLWRDYHWPVKLVFSLIILSSLWATALVGWPELDAGIPRWLRMLASDPLRYLLSVLIAFLIAINFYMRARRGILDGDEHYNVARALAFGYFKNFLVPALQLARGHGCKLQIFRPNSMTDMQQYMRQLQPRILAALRPSWLPLVEQPAPDGPPRRTVLALQEPSAKANTAQFFFDAPTALFTIVDFYAALNRRRCESEKAPLDEATIQRYQNGQIDSFFNHLDYLFKHSAGFDAVADIVTDAGELSELRAHLETIDSAALEQRYPA
ncbi:MAG: hypothetical protein Tsb0027_06470 [Wenzhouxiangellaceae bacterium]